jgi:hypothetical protein
MAIAIAVVLQYSGESMATLPPRDVQRLERLFDQQMWAFGRDATRVEGNLLALRGFSRTPPPPGRDVSGTYRLREDGLELELSSLGVRARSAGGEVFLDRDPMMRQVPRVDGAALAALMRWVADYEAWVQRTAGADWRGAALGQRSRPPAFDAASMPHLWRELAARVDEGSSG